MRLWCYHVSYLTLVFSFVWFSAEYLSDTYTGGGTLLARIKADDAVKQAMLEKSEARADQTNLERLLLAGAKWEDLAALAGHDGADKVKAELLELRVDARQSGDRGPPSFDRERRRCDPVFFFVRGVVVVADVDFCVILVAAVGR